LTPRQPFNRLSHHEAPNLLPASLGRLVGNPSAMEGDTMFLKRLLPALALFLFAACAAHRGNIYPLPDNRGWFVCSEGASWGVLIPVVKMTKMNERRSNDGKALYAHFSVENVNLSMWMEPINSVCGDSIDCTVKNMLEKDRTIRASEGVRTYKHDKYTVVEYYLRRWPEGMPPVQGAKAGDQINQFNMNALLFRNGYWVDIHLSRLIEGNITVDKMRESFKTILQHIKLVDQKV